MTPPNQAQEEAISETQEVACRNGCSRYEVSAMAQLGEGLEVSFRYDNADTEDGLEITVFADDGSVVTSQDFG